jgi:hypothetical protein
VHKNFNLKKEDYMATELPYLASYKNVSVLFEKIATAKIPDAFTHKYLQDIIGLKGTGDRSLIALLRSLGFIDASSKPTSAYSTLKNPTLARKAIAAGVRMAYKDLFDANELANQISSEELKGLISQVAGTETAMTTKIAGTFSALVKISDFTGVIEALPSSIPKPKSNEQAESNEAPSNGLRPEFHYNIQIHLPANGSEETYLNIFNAVRKVFK